MRVGAVSRGGWFVSMSPLGWLIVGPFIAVFYIVHVTIRLAIYAAILLGMLAVGLYRLAQRGWRRWRS